MMKIGIVGGAGYTAGELMRLLIHHPRVEIAWVHSKSQASKAIHEVHKDLLGETKLYFTDQLAWNQIDLLFLCVGHGEAKVFLEANQLPHGLSIIDLSQDFRLEAQHDFIYGLPELQRERIRGANFIANPGCFATCIQLALLPLAYEQKLNSEIHMHAITGSTGAGQAPKETTHYSWRNNNVSIYKAFNHQHLGEIGQSLRQLQSNFSQAINFIPMRGNFTRGILASVYLDWKGDLAEAKAIYETYYQDHPFVWLSEQNPDLKQVVNTNKAILYLQQHENKLHIISLIDNLLKGASGQAVQNMNLMQGWDERTGLGLKASYF